jgi:ATP synthase protein I
LATGPGKKDDDDGLSDQARALRQAAPDMDAVWRLLGGAVLGVAGGYFLDRWLGTTPWLLLVGAILGIGMGFTGFIVAIVRLGKRR